MDHLHESNTGQLSAKPGINGRGQMVAKLVLSAVMVPLVIALAVRIGRQLDQGA